jgi:UDP-2-acetamido-3-amino-2,3-dideoxy-glucuronate N-acetyltransferase
MSELTDTGYYCHHAALVESKDIGLRTRIWAFVHILPGARVGADCNVCDGVFIEGGAVVGDRVTVKCGVQLWNGVTLEDDVFVGPNATFTNDPWPRSRRRPDAVTPTLVRTGATIGANATILCGVTIGAHAMVGVGAVVTRDVPPNAIVMGNPAHVAGYVDVPARPAPAASVPVSGSSDARVRGVSIRRLPEFEDLRGCLIAGEVGPQVPFEPRRVFIVHDVPTRHVRGEHAHRAQHQFFVCLKGRCTLVVDDGGVREQIVLDAPTIGVHVPPLVWATQYGFSADAMLLVLASDKYDPAEYIRDYAEFKRLVTA